MTRGNRRVRKGIDAIGSLTGKDLTLTSLTTRAATQARCCAGFTGFGVGAPPAIRQSRPARGCARPDSKQQEAHMFTNSILRKIILTGAVLGCLASAREASANLYTAPITAMGVAHCTGGSPAGWKVIPWVKFSGYYWSINELSLYNYKGSTGYYESADTTHASAIAQVAMMTGQVITGGCVSGTGMSNCANLNWCGDGRTYYQLDSIQLGN
jgi:hypothetical protein